VIDRDLIVHPSDGCSYADFRKTTFWAISQPDEELAKFIKAS
jgi:hypothetical protein